MESACPRGKSTSPSLSDTALSSLVLYLVPRDKARDLGTDEARCWGERVSEAHQHAREFGRDVQVVNGVADGVQTRETDAHDQERDAQVPLVRVTCEHDKNPGY